MPYRSTKRYQNLGPVAYRQWRADSHCNQIHGYALSFVLTFESEHLDARNWVVDFGGLREVKDMLESQFDHTLLVAHDDPHKDWYFEAQKRGIAKVIELPALGCEALAELVFDWLSDWLATDGGYGDRVRLVSVEVLEHENNTALFVG